VEVSNRYYELNNEVVMTSPNENQATGPIIAVAAATLIPPILRRLNKRSSNFKRKQSQQTMETRLLSSTLDMCVIDTSKSSLKDPHESRASTASSAMIPNLHATRVSYQL
jgi:hypothetical protein